MKIINVSDRIVLLKELIPTALFESRGKTFIKVKVSGWLRGDAGAVYGLDLESGDIKQFSPEDEVKYFPEAEIHL